MVAISARGFDIVEATPWLPDIERRDPDMCRYFEVRPKGSSPLSYLVVVRDNGSYEVLRRHRGRQRDQGVRWPTAPRKMAFTIIRAIWLKEGNPWAP